MIDPQEFGREVARAQDCLNDASCVEHRAESLLFDGPNPVFARPVKSRTYVRWVVTAAAAALVLVTIGVFRYGTAAPGALSVSIDGTRLDPNARPLVLHEAVRETTLAFSDGSSVRLAQNARARIVDITSSGARMLLEQGRLAADIAHLDGAEWRFFAGPFEVHVTGTRFTLDWDAVEEHFVIEMEEGSVDISGPSPDDVRSVRGGDTFTADLKDRRLPAAVQRDETFNPVIEEVSPDRIDSDNRPAPIATPRDFCRGLDPVEQLALADTARLSGEARRAEQEYSVLRRCFPGSRGAVLSAFYLGKIAFDDRRDWDVAARWFERYLREQQGEGTKREALGRLMEAYAFGHRLKKAQAAAHRYLAEYSGGPHAAYAASLLEEVSDSTPEP